MKLVYILNLLGVAVFAVSGALVAGRKSLDLLGVIVLATLTAIGGGTIRDILLDRPIFWIRETENLTVIVVAALLTVVYVRFRRPPTRLLLVADALGLALFTISGAHLALDAGLPGVIVVVMGVITGVAGGVMRDVLAAEIPLILRPGELYATAAITGAVVYLLLETAGVARPLPTLFGVATIAILRFASIIWRIKLPVFTVSDPPES